MYRRPTKKGLIGQQVLAAAREGEEARLNRLCEALAQTFGLETLAPGNTPERQALRAVAEALWRSFPKAGEDRLVAAIRSLDDLNSERRRHLSGPWNAFWLVAQRLKQDAPATAPGWTPQQEAWLKMRGGDYGE